MMNNIQSFQVLRQENYQLKNQISELKNAFDLNRDILKILSEQSRNKNPDSRIYFQIIRRLTSLNNQTMVIFTDLIHQKSVLKDQNRMLISENSILTKKLQHLTDQIQNKTHVKQIHIQMRQEMQVLRKQLLQMNEQLVLKDQEIKRMKKHFQGKLNNSKQRQLDYESLNTLNTFDTRETQNFQRVNPSRLYKTPALQNTKYILNDQMCLKNKLLTRQINELEGRMLILLKALNLDMNYLKKKNEDQKPLEKDLIMELLRFSLDGIKVSKNKNSEEMEIQFVQEIKNQKTKRSMSL